MIKTKFRLWAFLSPTLTILVTGLLYVILSKVIFSATDNPPTAVYVFIGIFLFTWTWLVFGELRTKAIKVSIDNNSVSTINFLGFGLKRQFDLKEFDGFTTSVLPSRGGNYEYLYLVKDNKKIVKLSEFYHKNYSEFKQDLNKKVKFLGRKEFNMLSELREIFQ